MAKWPDGKERGVSERIFRLDENLLLFLHSKVQQKLTSKCFMNRRTMHRDVCSVCYTESCIVSIARVITIADGKENFSRGHPDNKRKLFLLFFSANFPVNKINAPQTST